MTTSYNLEKVNIIADNDKDFVQTLVETFLEEVPHDAKLLKQAVENQNHLQTYQVAHKMKPSIELFGVQGYDNLIEIQDWGKFTKSEDVNEHLATVLLAIDKAIDALKADFNI